MVHCTHRRTISLTVSPRTLPHFLRSAILSPFSVSMRRSLSAALLPLKETHTQICFFVFFSCFGELPMQLSVALNVTNVKCNPEVPYNNVFTFFPPLTSQQANKKSRIFVMSKRALELIMGE